MCLSNKLDVSFGVADFLSNWGFISLRRTLFVRSFAELRLTEPYYQVKPTHGCGLPKQQQSLKSRPAPHNEAIRTAPGGR